MLLLFIADYFNDIDLEAAAIAIKYVKSRK